MTDYSRDTVSQIQNKRDQAFDMGVKLLNALPQEKLPLSPELSPEQFIKNALEVVRPAAAAQYEKYQSKVEGDSNLCLWANTVIQTTLGLGGLDRSKNSISYISRNKYKEELFEPEKVMEKLGEKDGNLFFFKLLQVIKPLVILLAVYDIYKEKRSGDNSFISSMDQYNEKAKSLMEELATMKFRGGRKKQLKNNRSKTYRKRKSKTYRKRKSKTYKKRKSKTYRKRKY